MGNYFLVALQAIIYGIVEGITEWLPVSSTGHLIILDSFFKTSETYGPEFWSFFLVIIQLGAILAVIIGFFKELNPINPNLSKKERTNIRKVWLKIIIGVIPAGIVGVLLEAIGFSDAMGHVLVVATTLAVYGVLFILIEQYRKKKDGDVILLKEMQFYSKNHPVYKYDDVKNLDYKIVIVIGLAQILSLIPGTSRSGVTILAALLLGCSRTCASKFSFYLSIPVMLGASLIKLVTFMRTGVSLTTDNIILLVVGLVFGFLTSVLIIKTLMKFIRKHTFIGFGYYRIALSILLFVLFGAGLITY